jgi:hypothetical protein
MQILPTTDPTRQLRLVLTINATTSGVAGLTALVAGEHVARLLGTGHAGWVRIVGGGLAVFALAVLAVSRSDDQQLRRWVPAVSAADASWVAASIATVLLGWYSASGAVIVAAMAAMVATFAIAQVRLWLASPTPSTR